MQKETRIEKILEIGSQCEQCGHCCQHGTGMMTNEDKKNIAKYLDITEKKLEEKYLEKITIFNTMLFRPKTIKKPFGNCVFLEGKKCKIHQVKPIQCKIGTCKSEEASIWFKLNYLVNNQDPESIRQWNTYLQSGGKNIPGGELEKLVPDEKILKKMLSYEVLK